MKPVITTHFSKMKDIPEDYTKIVITRFPPKWLKIEHSKKIFLIKELSPHYDILMDCKKDGDWDKYIERFNRQMAYDSAFKRVIHQLKDAIEKKNKKYALICYEKDGTMCHRQLVAKHIENQFNIEWEEM